MLRDIQLITTVIGFFVNILVVTGLVVWTVGKIRTSSEVLNTTVEHLTQAIGKLEVTSKELGKKLGSHETRISLLEQQSGQEQS